MQNATAPSEIQLRAPGPGVWQLDQSHFARPMTRFVQSYFPDAFAEGQARSLSRYGAPLKTIKLVPVDGFPYFQPQPLGGKPGAPPPPRWLFAVLARVLPAFRRCARIAQAAFDKKLWREDARRWTEEVWPALEARFVALQRESLAELDDEALLDHLERTRRAQVDSIVAHFETNPATMVPSGRLALNVARWTALEPAEILSVLRGSSRVLRAEQAQLDELRALIRPGDLEGAPAEVLERLRTRADELGVKARAWLERVEHRQVWAGDVYLPSNVELPHLLVEQLRAAPRPEPDLDSAAAAVRAKVPAEHRATFDDLLEDARATVYLRDERSSLNDAWAGGLVRRALLEIGRRLAKRDLLASPRDVVHLTQAECASLLRRGDGPSRQDVAAWAAAQARTSDSAPAFLGGGPEPAPPFEVLPGALGELLVAAFAYVDLMEGDLTRGTVGELRGTPASAGEHVGIARLVLGPDDFLRIRPGDVLVARATMPSYNGALAVAGAVVTDRGGALSHAAIVSRELGIPAVVSTRTATQQIPEGARVRVNGSTGEVSILP
jgi:rifampicin phosphotransferase